MKHSSLEMFTATQDFLIGNNLPKDVIVRIVIYHLKCLETTFQKCFPSNFDYKKPIWVHKPYSIEIKKSVKPLKVQEEFAELSSDTGLKLEFLRKKSLNKF